MKLYRPNVRVSLMQRPETQGHEINWEYGYKKANQIAKGF